MKPELQVSFNHSQPSNDKSIVVDNFNEPGETKLIEED